MVVPSSLVEVAVDLGSLAAVGSLADEDTPVVVRLAVARRSQLLAVPSNLVVAASEVVLPAAPSSLVVAASEVVLPAEPNNLVEIAVDNPAAVDLSNLAAVDIHLDLDTVVRLDTVLRSYMPPL